MSSVPELFDEAALLDRLVAGAVAGKRPVTFLVGSPLTAPAGPQRAGVPDVQGMIEQVRKELGDAGLALPDHGGNPYQAAFRALLASRGPGTVSRLVRQAVLQAALDPPADLLRAALDGDPIECRRACDALERNLAGWGLSPGAEDLGRLVASFPRRFGQAVLTSNFDPLIEVGIQRAGGACWRTTPQGDGSLQHSRGHGCHVVHVHGYWYDADTLHIPSHLQAERPQLRASLRRLFEDTTLVVVAYGGWDDVFSRALIDAVSDGGAFPEVVWTFYDSDERAVRGKAALLLERLRPGLERAGRVTLYGGVDCHTLFRKLWERLPAGLEHAAWEIRRSDRQDAADELDRMAEELAAWSGAELVRRLLAGLAAFSERFVRPGCGIAVVARSSPDEFLFRGASEGIEGERLDLLSELSRQLGHDLRPWSGGEPLPATGSLGQAGVAIPLRFPGQKIGGHLFFLHELPFSLAEIGLLLEVGRSIAFLVKAERDRLVLRGEVGRFRHALLGPIQGLISAARVLGVSSPSARLLDVPSPPATGSELVRRARQQFEEQVEIIRLVQASQRLLFGERLQVELRPVRLKDLLLQCQRRYQKWSALRGIDLKMAAGIPQGLTQGDEDALDLALSNLLNNAFTFSFHGRDVVLGAKRTRGRLQIWVEYVGLPPAPVDPEAGDRDPYRPIAGIPDLALAAAIARAHGGTLAQTSEPFEGVEGVEGERARCHRVRVTLDLPLART